jgi:hypothetical protein
MKENPASAGWSPAGSVDYQPYPHEGCEREQHDDNGCKHRRLCATGGSTPPEEAEVYYSPFRYSARGMRRRLKSLKISRAALWPGAPVTPPPGWPPEPHK